MNAYFLEPLDVLFLRGNRLFGDAGSYGESMVPPWPSAAAGAIRSAILARDGVDLAAFARGEVDHAGVGGRDAPGDFRVTDFQLAWHGPDGEGALEWLYPLPADLVATQDENGEITLHPLSPTQPVEGIESSGVTVLLPVMPQAVRAKPASGLWLTEAGMRDWLGGRLPDTEGHLVSSEQLWLSDERVGIGMDGTKRRADDGKLFTMQAVALRPGVGFVATVEGDGLADGTLVRLGGDGRGAVVRNTEAVSPGADLETLSGAGRCRIVLSAPSIFASGWRPFDCDAEGRFESMGVRGRLVCATVPRAEVVSGWDLARWQPKPARRAAPAGSVYWIEDLQATPEQLRRLAVHGLWPESGYDAQRRAEGFNHFIFATY